MNVLVIPEDFRKDQYILKPIVAKMLAEADSRRANVRVCLDPLIGGLGEATKWPRIAEVLDMYRGMVDVFLLIVDRDGDDARRARLDYIEAQAAEALGADRVLFAEHAWREIEVWALAGVARLPSGWTWQAVRAEPNSKEVYFLPYAAQRELGGELGQGRDTLGREAAQNYRRVRSRCPEDVGVLENRIQRWIQHSRRET